MVDSAAFFQVYVVSMQCLVPVLSCRGWGITTVEGLGSCKDGLDKVQKALSDHYGTQCGFCTPGMVMTMKG